MIKNIIETKRIKDAIVSYRIWKKMRIFIVLITKGFFCIWSVIKKLLKYFWVDCITVYYWDVIQYQSIVTSIVEPKFTIPQADVDISIPFEIRSFANQRHYDYMLCRIPHGRIMWQSTITTKDNTIIRNLTRWSKHWYATNPWAYFFKPKSVIKKSGTAIMLRWNDTFQNFHHRVFLGISKYYLYQKESITPDRYIIDNQKEFHKQAIQALWIPQERIISPRVDEIYEFDMLVATTTPTIYGIIPPRMGEFMQNTFLPQSLPQTVRKIYLKRTWTRRVLNEKEFDNYLISHWFEIITTSPNTAESLDAELFASASHVISPHGAGITKIIFCKPHTKLIELFHPDTLFGHYYAMSQSIDLDYYCFVGEKDGTYEWLDMDAPIIIDREKFDLFMKREWIV